MKALFAAGALVVAALGCASTDTEIVNEPAGADIENWATEARDIHQRPYGWQRVPPNQNPTNPPPSLSSPE